MKGSPLKRLLRKAGDGFGLCVLPLLALPLHAAPLPWPWPADPLQSADQQSQPPHLLWLNAEGQHLDDGELQLDAGEQASLQLPAAGHLRLQIAAGMQPPALWLSEDGRLWQQADWQRSSTPGEWLYVQDDAPPRFARLQAAAPVKGRLLLATRQSIGLPARNIEITGLTQGMQPALPAQTLTDSAGNREFGYQLAASQSLELPVSGPALLAIGSRPLEASSTEPYSLQWQLDASSWQPLLLTQSAINPTWDEVAGCALPGTLQRRYLAIPAGQHRLRLQSSAALLLTLEQSDPEPFALNQPAAPLLQRLQPLLPGQPQAGALAGVDALRQSNQRQEAASQALARLQPVPGNESLPTAEALRLQIERSQRSYRNLLPQQLPAGAQPQTAWFSAGRPLQFSASSPLYLAASGPISGLAQGLFVPAGAQALQYPLPARSHDSRLRLAIALPDTHQQAELQLQFDDQPARRLQLQPLADAAVQASAAEARLSALSGNLPTLSADFVRLQGASPQSSSQGSGQHWRVASAELELPAGVRQLQIRSSQPVQLAAQLRVDQPFVLDEASYRAQLQQIPPAQLAGSLRRALQRYFPQAGAIAESGRAHPAETASSVGAASAASSSVQAAPKGSPLKRLLREPEQGQGQGQGQGQEPEQPPSPESTLHNQWYPLLRHLQAASATWLDDFSPDAAPAPLAQRSQRLQQAEAAARSGQWPAVLEALGTLGYGHDLRAYQLSQQALTQLAEPALARRQRMAAALLGADEATRRQARSDLLGEYARTQDANGALALLATLWLRGDDSQLPALGQALLAADQPLWATQLGLLLAQQGRSPDWLAAAARQAGWLTTASSALQSLPASTQALQRGELALLAGDPAQALQHWQQAGAAGASRRMWLQQGQSIARELASSAADEREAAVNRWLGWAQSASWQDWRWSSLHEQITQAAGYSSLFSEVSRSSFALPRASRQQPVELEVIGPTLLRLQVRQLLDGTPQPDWLLAEVAGRNLRYPLDLRAATPYLQPLDGGTISSARELLLPVPAGLQRIRLYSQQRDLLLQLDQWQPAAVGGPLPPLTPLTLRAALAGPQPVPVASRLAGSAGSTRYELVGNCQRQPVQILSDARLYSHQLTDSPAVQAAVQRLQFARHSPQPADWPAGSTAVDSTAVDSSTASAPATDGESAFQQAVTLLWQQEQAEPGSPSANAASAQIARLAQDWPQVEALQAVQQRATASYQWEPLLTAFESAGVRPLPEHPQLNSPFRRVRDALLPGPMAEDTLWLQGREVQGISLSSPAPLQLRLQLRQPALPFSRLAPAQVMLQLDEQPPQRITLQLAPSPRPSPTRGEGEKRPDASTGISGQPQTCRPHEQPLSPCGRGVGVRGIQAAPLQPDTLTTHNLNLPAGTHALRLWLADPLLQQRVAVQVLQAGEALLPAEERTWHIAAAGQPARFELQGPLWLRIQEWRAGGALPRYQYLPEGWQSVSLPAGSSGEDRYYRLAALRPGTASAPLPSMPWHASIAAPQPTPAQLPPPPVHWRVQDAVPPGTPLSSLGGYLEFSDRNASSEDDSSTRQPERQWEVGLRYRQRLPDRQLFARTDLLLRQPAAGPEVLGLRQWLDYYPPYSPWQLGLLGEAFVQPGTLDGLQSNSPWSAHLQGKLQRRFELTRTLQHELELALDQHWLSEGDLPSTALGELDRDIYSPYREDHRRALSLSDRLSWTPWLDQRLYAEAGAVSNEDLNLASPDYLRLTLAAGQLFGPVSVEGGMRWRHYFADDDRSNALNRSKLFLRVNGLRWGSDSNAVQLRSELGWDLDNQTLSLQVSLAFDDNAGGLSPAMRPAENDFLPLRRALQRDQVERNRLQALPGSPLE